MNPLLSLVERKLEALPLPVQLQMPDGQVAGRGPARLRFVVRERRALAPLARGDIGWLARDYVEGRIDIDGSMRDLMAVAAALLPEDPVDPRPPGWPVNLLRRLRSLLRHAPGRDARQIAFHYDLSDDFYALWLDPRRVYSCAYFNETGCTLARAQEAKLDLICRKLRLARGERFLDVGAGWGGLLLWAARHYGVQATGITLSRNQQAHVQREIDAQGLTGQVRIALQDYRELEADPPFDKIASVGMFEHVGRARLDAYFATLRGLLRPGGLILNHGITAAGVHNAELGRGLGQFIETYIFPGGELTHISHVLAAVTGGRLETLDVENLRPHYARTLWAWSDALEARLPQAAAILGDGRGERVLRAYRLYLAGCAMAFEQGWVALHQVLASTLATGRSDELDMPLDLSYPWQRGYMYR
ncbi:class I SAM-dependent methyltransferase [Bordetella genomosp. 5]|uniref:class I SAM-dependent methyltransferase n=1 Tax=Bordetella genomosp. 5 TaxID=1395608 RepID=UPI000B9DF210|nr:class I SAM-dependent methyltransferase [Bordetella genomosp. 5]